MVIKEVIWRCAKLTNIEVYRNSRLCNDPISNEGFALLDLAIDNGLNGLEWMVSKGQSIHSGGISFGDRHRSWALSSIT